jgi:hypothetical protein
MPDITPNTRFSVQLAAFLLILGSVWGAGYAAANAIHGFRAQAEQDKREIRSEIRDLREEVNRGQNALTMQMAGGWTLDNQRRWSRELERSNPELRVPDPDEVRGR